jgi:hypothetical protein
MHEIQTYDPGHVCQVIRISAIDISFQFLTVMFCSSVEMYQCFGGTQLLTY